MTPLSASLRWRPIVVISADGLASFAMALRGGVVYAREVLGWSVFTPGDLWRWGPAQNRAAAENDASFWSTAHATAMATVCIVLVWAAFIPFWWALDVSYYQICHPAVLSNWADDLSGLTERWRELVKFDVALTLVHFILDAAVKRCARR